MVNFQISRDWKPRPRSSLLGFRNFCLLMIAHWATTAKSTCNKASKYTRACDDFGLTISTKNTKVMYQPPLGEPYSPPRIIVKDQEVSDSDHFIYLISTLSEPAVIDEEVNNQIARASSAFGCLRRVAWGRAGVKTFIKSWCTRQLSSHHCSLWLRDMNCIPATCP